MKQLTLRWGGNAGDLTKLHKPFKSKDFFQLGTEDKAIDLKPEKDSVFCYSPEDGEGHVAEGVGSF